MALDENELIRRSVALAEENNQILRRLERHMRMQRIMSWIYWIIIIGSILGAYYFVQPYIQAITGQNVSNNIGNFIKNFNQTPR